MEMAPLIIGIILVLLLLVFGFYALLAVRHAAHFRYLSTRTIYLTLSFTLISTLLIVGILFVYGAILFN